MSPHFNLTTHDQETERAEFLLERSRLHFRTGKYLLRTNRIIHGYATLYDALISAFEYFILTNKKTLPNIENFDINDFTGMYQLLNTSNILKFDFLYFDKLLDYALSYNLGSIDSEYVIKEIDQILHILKVYPFDESLLPPIQLELLINEKGE